MTRLRVLLFVLTACALPVHADVMYQCVDDDGHKSFSNIKPAAKGPKCTAMNFPDAPASPAAKSAAVKAPTPASFPKVDEGAQKARDNDRRRILEGELAAEKKELEKAKAELAAQDESALPEERIATSQSCTTAVGKDGKPTKVCTTTPGGINQAKVDERLQPYKDKVALHERNIEAIQKELARLQ